MYNIQVWGRFDVGPTAESVKAIDEVNSKYANQSMWVNTAAAIEEEPYADVVALQQPEVN